MQGAFAGKYLRICDGEVELRDGAPLWGRLSGAVQDVLTAETDTRARTLQRGNAGERGNLMANILNGLKHFNAMRAVTGWDPETGWPTFAKLAELGIEWAASPGDTW